MSSSRKVIFSNGEYYHVFNRGVEKRPTFTNTYEFSRAIDLINFYRFGDLPIRYSKYLALDKNRKTEFFKGLDKNQLQVDIIAYCLMGNHFHFLLKQLKEGGIVNFMAKFTNSYTKYFNARNERVGPLFQGVFKAVYVESNEQLIHLSRYIHLNPVAGFIIKIDALENYQWSSYPEYLGIIKRQIANTTEIMSFFKDTKEYKKFVLDQADYLKKFEKIKYITID